MHVISGIFFHFLGGFASGSFYLPFKKIKGWSWESGWIVGGIFSWLLVPFISAFFTVPDFLSIIKTADKNIIFWTYFMGVLWGIGGLTFGLSMRYLGMSLGMSVALGFTSAFGALVPPIYRDLFTGDKHHTFSQMLQAHSGILILLGVFVCLAGIFFCGRAGMLKEKELSDEQKKEGVQEFNLRTGLIVATVSGILSACFNFGIEAGEPLADAAIRNGSNPLFQNNVIFVVLLWGGFSTNFIWCLFLNFKNRSFTDYLNKKSLGNNYLFAALAGTTWFMQFFFYGMGESKLGNGASSWILHMALIILVSSMWGILLKEWKGVSKKTYVTILSGIAIIILSVIIVGYGNSLNDEILVP